MNGKGSVHVESALDADAAMWMATGDTLIDEHDPISQLAQAIDRKIDPNDYREWLTSPLPDGRTPRECMAQEDFNSLFESLAELPDRESPVIMTSYGR